jgi:transaldolase
MYVEELVGRDTVNTMPPATLKALLQGADVKGRLHENHQGAVQLLDSLSSYGVDFASLLVELQVAGVKSFADSYKDLLASIEEKRKKV